MKQTKYVISVKLPLGKRYFSRGDKWPESKTDSSVEKYDKEDLKDAVESIKQLLRYGYSQKVIDSVKAERV